MYFHVSFIQSSSSDCIGYTSMHSLTKKELDRILLPFSMNLKEDWTNRSIVKWIIGQSTWIQLIPRLQQTTVYSICLVELFSFLDILTAYIYKSILIDLSIQLSEDACSWWDMLLPMKMFLFEEKSISSPGVKSPALDCLGINQPPYSLRMKPCTQKAA